MASIADQGPEVPGQSLDSLVIGLPTLPGDYLDFLMKSNGGRPVPATFAVEAHDEGEFDVQVLFGVSRAVESSNIGWNAKEYRSLVDRGIVPVGCTDTGDLICVSCCDGGGVVFFDAEDGETYEVAPSFDCFLRSLYDGG